MRVSSGRRILNEGWRDAAQGRTKAPRGSTAVFHARKCKRERHRNEELRSGSSRAECRWFGLRRSGIRLGSVMSTEGSLLHAADARCR